MSKIVVIFFVLFCTTVWSQEYGLFQSQVLQAHNRYRSRHCVEPLELDDELSQRAQILAERNAQSYGFLSTNTEGYGQNSFHKTNSWGLDVVHGNEPVKSWYNGLGYYDFNRGGFSQATGSFTQLVWASSRRLGVGIVFSRDRRSAFIVALYDPPGNFANAFQRNVFPDQC